MRRGEIWWAEFGAPVGSEPAYERPVLIVQSDRWNLTRLRTVITLGFTANLAAARYDGNVALDAAATALPQDSVVNVTQIAAIDRARLVRKVGELSSAAMEQVDDGLRLVLDL